MENRTGIIADWMGAIVGLRPDAATLIAHLLPRLLEEVHADRDLASLAVVATRSAAEVSAAIA